MSQVISPNQLRAIPSIKQVVEVANVMGLECYIIGGYVRDLHLGRTSKDIDFVCLGSGIDFAKAVSRKLSGSTLTVFKNFGTAMVKWQNMELEFVGARRESYRSDSRKPIVEDGSLEDDQNRRDFTINAMAISLNKNNFAALLDPFNGVADIKKKQIRTPLAAGITFSDDPLRMMRAIRFASQLVFDIEATTFEGITNNIDRIDIVSKERITDELNKIILSDTPSYGFKLLFHSGLLKKIFPKMVTLHGVEEINGKTHKDNFYHTLQVLDNVAKTSKNIWLRWAAILHDIAKPATKRFNDKSGWTFHGHEDKGARMVPGIFREMKLPLNENMAFVKKLVRLHLRPIALVKNHITDSAIRRLLFEAGEDIDDLMLLCRADITSKNDVKVKKYLNNFKKVEEKLVNVEAKDNIKSFQPPVTGQVIMTEFGLAPSREVGEIKDAIREAILDGKIDNNYNDAFKMMLDLGKQFGLKSVNNN